MAKLGNFLHSSTEQAQGSVESGTLGKKNGGQQKLTKQNTGKEGQQRKGSIM